MRFASSIVLSITLQCIASQQHNSDRFFTHIQEYCTSQQGGTSQPSTSLLGLRVGKAGPIGPRGPKGEPGEVDFSVVNGDMNSVREELKNLKNEVSLLRELLHWYRASNGYLYKLFNTKKTWQQAKDACKSKGAILASVGIRNSAVRSELQSYTNLQTTWIGVSDIAQEGTWIWEDGVASTGDDIGWKSLEPNNAGGNEDCAVLHNLSNNWVANDGACTYTTAYLCEKSP